MNVQADGTISKVNVVKIELFPPSVLWKESASAHLCR